MGQALITHHLADMARFRMLTIAAGYEDSNDATSLRSDPMFIMAQGIAPSGRHLASQPTISRLENMADMRALLRMGQAMVTLYCASFRQMPERVVLDNDSLLGACEGTPSTPCTVAGNSSCSTPTTTTTASSPQRT